MLFVAVSEFVSVNLCHPTARAVAGAVFLRIAPACLPSRAPGQWHVSSLDVARAAGMVLPRCSAAGA